jgi:hypothetical protein
VSKVSAYLEMVVNTRLRAAKNDTERQAKIDQGIEVFPMSKPEVVGSYIVLHRYGV